MLYFSSLYFSLYFFLSFSPPPSLFLSLLTTLSLHVLYLSTIRHWAYNTTHVFFPYLPSIFPRCRCPAYVSARASLLKVSLFLPLSLSLFLFLSFIEATLSPFRRTLFFSISRRENPPLFGISLFVSLAYHFISTHSYRRACTESFPLARRYLSLSFSLSPPTPWNSSVLSTCIRTWCAHMILYFVRMCHVVPLSLILFFPVNAL